MSQARASDGRAQDALRQAPIYVGQYPCRLTVRRQGSRWVAIAEVTTEDGPVRFSASADEDLIARRLSRHVAVAGSFDLGSVLQQIAGGSRQLAQSRSVRDVLRTVSEVTRQPIVQTAVSFIPGVGPVAAPALAAASTLLDASERGDPRSLANLGTIASAARGGHPLAGRAMQVLATVHGASRRAGTDRFEARSAPPTRAPSYTAPAPRQQRSGSDLGGLVASLLGAAGTIASEASSSSRGGRGPDVGSILGSLLGVATSIASAAPSGDAAPSASREGWRDVRPEQRSPAEHRAAYELAMSAGLGEAYREAATVGAWEGARWLWNQVKPQPLRSEPDWTTRSGYAEGVRLLGERASPRLMAPSSGQ